MHFNFSSEREIEIFHLLVSFPNACKAKSGSFTGVGRTRVCAFLSALVSEVEQPRLKSAQCFRMQIPKLWLNPRRHNI